MKDSLSATNNTPAPPATAAPLEQLKVGDFGVLIYDAPSENDQRDQHPDVQAAISDSRRSGPITLT